MARYISMEEPQTFRAVIFTTYPDGRYVRSVQGPYSTEGQAKAQITRERRRAEHGYYRSGTTVSGHVETSDLNWRRV